MSWMSRAALTYKTKENIWSSCNIPIILSPPINCQLTNYVFLVKEKFCTYIYMVCIFYCCYVVLQKTR